MKCVECEWLQIKGADPFCSFCNRIVPAHMSTTRGRRAADKDLRNYLARVSRDSGKDFDRKGECRWAAFEHAEQPYREEDE